MSVSQKVSLITGIFRNILKKLVRILQYIKNIIFYEVGTDVDQNKIGQSKFRLRNSIFLRNPSLRKQKCQKQKNNSDKCHHSTIFQKLRIIQLNKMTVTR
jgi:hypothetical protein